MNYKTIYIIEFIIVILASIFTYNNYNSLFYVLLAIGILITIRFYIKIRKDFNFKLFKFDKKDSLINVYKETGYYNIWIIFISIGSLIMIVRGINALGVRQDSMPIWIIVFGIVGLILSYLLYKSFNYKKLNRKLVK